MLNDTQKAIAAGRLIPQVLEEWGIDHEARVIMVQIMMSGSKPGQKLLDTVFMPALEEAQRRVEQGIEGLPPQQERK